MSKQTNVLVVCNDTDDFATLASQLKALFGQTGAEITLMQVIAEMPDRPMMTIGPRDLAGLAVSHFDSELSQMAASLASDGIIAIPRVVVGKPLPEIMRAALSGGFDVVVKTSERRGKRHLSAKGLDRRLLRACPLPLLLLGRLIPRKLKKLMVAVDVEPRGSESQDLTNKLLKTGLRVSHLTGARLHAFHAWQAPAEDAVRYRVSSELADQYTDDIRSSRWRLLTDAVHRSSVETSAIRHRFEKGVPRKVLPGIVLDEDVDLLIIGSVGRTGLSACFLGNTAEAVLRDIERPILVVKPDSFVSAMRMGIGYLKPWKRATRNYGRAIGARLSRRGQRQHHSATSHEPVT